MRSRRIRLAAAVAVLAVASVVVTTAVAGGGGSLREELEGYQEVPAISTVATGKFKAKVRGDRIDYELSYSGLEGSITQAHIHFAQRDVNGGISVWLCTTPGITTAPAGTQECKASPNTITGTITAANVGGPAAAQGIEAMRFDELVQAIEAGVTYVNVHSSKFPTGEIRAQLAGDDEDDD
jgi:hypothetical protein